MSIVSYQRIKYEHRDNPPYVCEGCDTIKHCMKPKFRYYPERAYMDYRLRLREAREGISLTEFQMTQIDSLISPLIKNGQSIAHIYATHKHEIPCDERTLYHYIEKGFLSVRNIDLPRKVKYKPRVRVKINKDFALKVREGRRHSDFLAYIEQTDESVAEMDTIIGCRGSKKVILTFYLRSIKLLLAFLLDSNTQNAVIRTNDMLEERLGIICFKNLFSVLLTDNGTEFLNPEAIERNLLCERRTRVFYCDPHSPGQKGGIEKDHVELRKILPKGKSFDDMSQEDLLLAVNHVNSYSRKSLNSRTPYEVAFVILDERFFEIMGLRKIPHDEVNLTPGLLKKQK